MPIFWSINNNFDENLAINYDFSIDDSLSMIDIIL